MGRLLMDLSEPQLQGLCWHASSRLHEDENEMGREFACSMPHSSGSHWPIPQQTHLDPADL